MGMIGNYLRITKQELEHYFSESKLLEDRIYNAQNYSDGNLMDIDKSWEGLFFLLTGESVDTANRASAPLLWILDPPLEIDPTQDMGYGPATYSNIEQTMEIHQALDKIQIDELKAKYDAKSMMELYIYPEMWEEEGHWTT